MKYLMSWLLILPLFMIGCSGNKSVTESECRAQGLVLKKEMRLNFRSGKYEEKYFCAER
ncbi:hypothetical protein [Halarcobacter ebronensis]|uniref:hypothetical protein n=1 Tax=Halarcobacter ebronensis TaxID=1462615 RepID=UPI0013E95D7C|nr:hypothetical protein [Halarcobacter ebronensis]